MNAQEPNRTSTDAALLPTGREHTKEHTPSEERRKSGKQVANQIRRAAGKTDARYWLPRLFRPINDRRAVASAVYQMIQTRIAAGRPLVLAERAFHS